jgi:hypothetical protein
MSKYGGSNSNLSSSGQDINPPSWLDSDQLTLNRSMSSQFVHQEGLESNNPNTSHRRHDEGMNIIFSNDSEAMFPHTNISRPLQPTSNQSSKEKNPPYSSYNSSFFSH